MDEALQRISLLIGDSNLKELQSTTVMIIGIGGVGSYAAEALARCGVGNLILVDGDKVALSNLNRQAMATYDTIDQPKVEAMKNRILSLNRTTKIETYELFYTKEDNEVIFNKPIDFVIDAIDTISSKLDIIMYAKEKSIPFISSMGMANRLDPTKLTISDLSKTTYDPLARVMRNQVKKLHINGKIPVICSTEIPSIQRTIVDEGGLTRKEQMPPASSPFVPSAAGLAMASYVVRTILKK
ncbi:MAG: tRNA threonylcarbamoyladenosine dehydratase [Erysipelotrichaceae bacterium]